MIEYQDKQPPEGINTTNEHPLKQFFILLVSAFLLLLIVLFVLQFTGSWIAKRIPFSYEQRVVQQLEVPFGDADAPAEMVAWLNDLAARLIDKMPVPEGMSVTVHYSQEQTFNAFATVGGNLLFYQGILEKMPHENAVAMVMAHEIAHVLHRDPIAGLGGGIASMVALFALTGNAGTGMAGDMLQRSGVIASAQFTRRMEELADEAALAAVNALYGHVGGAETLFELISENGDAVDDMPLWLERFASTHPLSSDRIKAISERAKVEGWRVEGDLTPLPKDFQAWLKRDYDSEL